MAEITKEMILEDFRKTCNKYKKKFPDSREILTRDFYRENGNYKETEYNSIFGSFKNLLHEYIKRYKIDIKALDESIEIEKKILQLQQDNKELTKDKKHLLKKSIQEDTLLELYQENLKKEFKYSISNSKNIIKSNKDMILNFSDLHLGEVVIPEQVNYVNTFNKEIAISRMNQLFEQLIRYAKKIIIKDLYIECNGDLFAGGIHQELVRNSDLNEVEAIFYLQR
ncbi:MAG TPA: hypothetical protein P5136_00460, partial [Methanofastidiosum sp.]|nr:hypothetical protein [Methanofastidiosum sp.]